KVMTSKDLDGVLSIEKEAFPTPWSRSLFQQEIDLAFSRHYVLTRIDPEGKKEIIGYIVFWIIHDEAQLQRIAVKKSARVQGIGSLLLEEMIRICGLEAVRSGSLEVRSGNVAAQMLYRKFGFKVIGIRKGYYTDTLEDALVMGFEIK
ncbi:MAG: ribosomal protein S18-alanine N-acetyltransferase, partial [Syntrophaceae bacterium]|nr:ribosomal protein S18-alanine N-acetyltransferase [Syntrophaceae bacterium]